ncbi:FliH/SctL family protein [Sphingomonas sp. BGYR3]|uniref:FliH/SctL family protein n=1 Tax=Sphingomonas sp. BGYR3 TaxID=2975483 RepID=UPI0021A3B411|nr:FliH/SctL family protein [Sphingomonas sp. BGYR3]MDG5488298.1 FliH/SctL family protein [Sphingomonas sp. BGYR3]
MSDFAPGFVSRHQMAADALARAFAPPAGFAERPIAPTTAAAAQPRSFSPETPGPRHFRPADPDRNPTEGWDPLSPSVEPYPAESALDAIDAARAAGYAEGMAAALSEIGQARERGDSLGDRIAAALASGAQIDRDRMAARLRATVQKLVHRIVGDTGIDADRMNARIAAAVELLADGSESALLRLHPDDMPLIEGQLPKSVFAVGDSAVDRGGFVLESASTLIEDGPALWLEQLDAAINRAAVPN